MWYLGYSLELDNVTYLNVGIKYMRNLMLGKNWENYDIG